ncbi:hypothetical protein [Campylobacter gastrosuis]|uniref:SGNH/GDSL hydrolase family protein n=1 Tax=Campylobacter gastrosuis TaxID=2974576 RepID=A0ABT7HPH6_9BACT|nr:hypothetical protein [Campylobacter gastrosuis]MDL0088637.1 hypothetical protein [Campylobacter gastrosuis]
MTNGLQKGLKEYANVTNLALGGTANLQNLYELKRDRNQEAIKNADLIITESFINELDNHNIRENLPFEIIFKNLQYLYATLYELKKPICILILPYRPKNHQIIANMHRFLANYFGLNIIDMQNYYKEHEIVQFGDKFGAHQLPVVSRYVGKEIAKNIDKFQISNKQIKIQLPEFKVLTPDNMQRNGSFKIFNPNNSMYNEIVYRLEKGNHLSFNGFEGYQILGIHSWNLENNAEITRLTWHAATAHCASFHIKALGVNIVKPTSKLNIFCEIQAEPIISDDFIIKFNDENLPNTEFYVNSHLEKPNLLILQYFDLIALLLCKPNPNEKLISLDTISFDTDMLINKEIDLSYLIPNIVFFRDSMEFIDEYIGYLYPNITRHIENVLMPKVKNEIALNTKPVALPNYEIDIKNIKSEIDILREKYELDIKNIDFKINILNNGLNFLLYESAKFRICNQLSYKLGKIMVENSKSLFSILKLPLVLVKEIKNYKKEKIFYNKKTKENPN